MSTYIKSLFGCICCISMVSCAHTEKVNFSSEQSFHYGKEQYLNYRTEGSGDKTLIFLHGFGASSQTWNDILPLLTDFDGKIIMFDLIGYGFSSKIDIEDYSFMANAKIISDFIETKKIKDYIIVGHSFGGGVALMTTIQQLEKSKYKPNGLILIDSAAYDVELPFFVSYLRTPLLGYTLVNFTPSNYQVKYSLKKVYYDKNKVTPTKIARYAHFIKMEGHNNTLLKSAKQIVPKNHKYYTSRYKSIDIPTLILWGEDDNVLSVDSAYQLADELPNTTLKVIDKCGHIPQEEYPHQIAKEINRFQNSLFAK